MARFVELLRRLEDGPEKRLREAGVAERMRLADIGAGFGYFAVPAAKMVGSNGLVYAVEPDARRTAEIATRAAKAQLRNIMIVKRKAEEMHEVPDGDVDLAIMMYSMHHIADKAKAVREVQRILKPGGVLYVRDIKAGRLMRHGSLTFEVRGVLAEVFREMRLDEGWRTITVLAKKPSS